MYAMGNDDVVCYCTLYIGKRMVDSGHGNDKLPPPYGRSKHVFRIHDRRLTQKALCVPHLGKRFQMIITGLNEPRQFPLFKEAKLAISLSCRHLEVVLTPKDR